MWLAPGWTSSAFAVCTQYYPQLGPASVLHGRPPHVAQRRSNLAMCRSNSSKRISTAPRNSRVNDVLLAQTAPSIGVRLESHAADTAVPLVATTSGASHRPGPGSSLTIAILESIVGDFSPRQARNVADSPAYRALEIHLLGNRNVTASRAEASLRELLEAITSVVGEAGEKSAAKVVAECPALLLCEGRELLATVQELRDTVRNVLYGCKVSALTRVALDEGDLKTVGQSKGPRMNVLFTRRVESTRFPVPEDRRRQSRDQSQNKES